MATIDLGKVAFVWKGTYASGTTYESKDVVQYTDSGETSSYIYVNASSASGQTPSTSGTVNTTYWNKMAGGSSGIWASGLSLGTANQVVKVNSSANALEFGTITSGEYSVHRIDSYSYGSSVTGTYNSSNYIDISGGNTVNFTPTSTNDFVFFSHGTRLNYGNSSQGGDAYIMMKGGSPSIGSGDIKLNYNGQHALYTNILNDQYWLINKSIAIPCTNLTVGTTYYAEQAGATHTAGSSMTFNGSATGGTGYDNGMHQHHVTMIHYKKN